MNATLYDQAIKELARAAHGSGTLAAPDAVVRLDNPYCGDRIELALRIGEGSIAALAHQTRGCLLCLAAASLIGLHAPGARVIHVEQGAAALDALLTGGDLPPGAWEQLEVFRPVIDYPARHDCVRLPMQALRKALQMVQAAHKRAAELDIAVTAVAPMYQCADTVRMARGRGSSVPSARQARVKPFSSSAFIGLPWPMKSAGMRVIPGSRCCSIHAVTCVKMLQWQEWCAAPNAAPLAIAPPFLHCRSALDRPIGATAMFRGHQSSAHSSRTRYECAVQVGDALHVGPGESVPVVGMVTEGSAHLPYVRGGVALSGTFPSKTLRPSAMVGCVRMASRSAV